MIFHRALTGNFYALKNKAGGQIQELIPLEPGWVFVRPSRDLTPIYDIAIPNGPMMQGSTSADIWHLRGPSWNSWIGLDCIKETREAIGLALATERSQALFHKNGMQTSGVIAVDGNLTSEQFTQLKNWVDRQIGGLNKHGALILDRAAKYQSMVMSGVDSQHLETRKMQVEEICRALGVNPIMVQHSGEARPTYASAEQFFLAHVIHTLSPWYSEIENSIDVNLIGEDDPAYAKFIDNGLLRGAAADRSAFYSKALGAGGSPAWMTQNEVRALEELNPLPGGDELPKPSTQPAPPSKDGAPPQEGS
jgi:HK97 family phage portal protein